LARLAGRIAERVMKNPPLTEQIALMTERRWYYDDGKARRELGYESRPLEQTMRDAVAWWKERGVG
jgi:dihydroflavonol-4-reductase